MPDHLDHLRWTRLELEPAIRPRQAFGTRPRLRPNPGGHGEKLLAEVESAVESVGELRRSSGIDPARLLVLRMRFLEQAQRDLLHRLGVEVVDEREERTSHEEPYYELTLHFAEVHIKDGFCQHPNVADWGITGFEDARASGGQADPLRLIVRFATLEQAKAFEQDNHAGCPIPLEVRKNSRKKQTETVNNVLTVQFVDQQALDRFHNELQAFRQGSAETLELTPNQRADLFDALEEVDHRNQDDKRGHRLQESGILQDSELLLDVDLWHPGSTQLVNEVINQLRLLVEHAGGEITGTVRPILQTLLITRVRGTRATLEALLDHDRVARVDLPPQLEPMQFTIFDAVPEQVDPVTIPADGPLACLVDSGVVSGHPLLRDLIVDEQDVDSGEDSPVDMVGHGTHVAGIIAYGDTWQQLQSGTTWEPKVRLLSAKVLRRIEEGFSGEIVRAGFAALERAEVQIENAIRRFAEDPDRRCRVFNLSLGNDSLRIDQRHQLPWALLLDELARSLDIVIVVSAGNVASPTIPAAPTESDLQGSIREQLLTDGHALIDPACAVNALTVRAISRNQIPFNRGDDPSRPDPVASPSECPSPFTRSGLLSSNGRGPCRSIKPELVAYGGNYSLLAHGSWQDNDPNLAEPSLHYRFTDRLLSAKCGTSVAAPFVTHVCSLIEYRMRLLNGGNPVSANLIRALACHGALLPSQGESWLCADQTDSQGKRRVLRVLGYGKPDAYRSCYSDDNRTLMYAQDELPEKHFHLYSFELPSSFLDKKGTRCIRVTLAYDPPIRGTRIEYMSRSMTMELLRGVSTAQIQNAVAKLEGDATAVPLPDSTKRLKNTTIYEWSTVQSAVCSSNRRSSFENQNDADPHRSTWHVLVGCKHRFPTNDTDQKQRYALVVSLEHSDETVQIHQALRTQIVERIRVRS